MDFTIRKPLHLLALLGLLGSLFLFIILPLLSIFTQNQISSVYTQSMTPFQKQLFEVVLLLFQFGFVIAGMIVVPLLWYKLVNRLTLKAMFMRLTLTRHGLPMALLWAIIVIVIAFGITMLIGVLYATSTGINPEDLSNIPDLQQLFSVPSLYLLVIIQPFCEEFFFRGFLLEKIKTHTNTAVAILITAILFGVSHLSYTYAYTAFIAVIFGILFAILVVKTKNLYAAIFAHTIINITSLSLYFFGKSLGF